MTTERMLRSWFKNSIQPSKTPLWISAIAPDTFQADPRLLEQLLKRPLELPDAMGQQRAIARYSACLIARAISEMNPNPSQLMSFLYELNFFQNPDNLLHKPLPAMLQASTEKLIQEAFDPTIFWEYELRILTQHFRESLHVLRTLFKVRKKPDQIPRITSFFLTEHEWWGTYYHPEAQIVNVHPPFLFLPAVSKSLVLRDAVRVFLPPSFQDALDVQEFANVLVAELLDSSERHLWSQIKWNDTQPTSEQHQWISTISRIIPTLIQEQHLPSLYKRLTRIDNLVSKVPTGSFTTITQLELNDAKTPPIITETQKKILLILAKNPMTSERQLAKATQLARGTINRNLLTLQEQFGIIFPGEINYQKIGLSPLLLSIHLPIGTKEEVSQFFELSQQLRAFPYCFRLHAPHSPTKTILYALLALPTNVIHDFHRYLEKWKETSGLPTQLFRINQFEWGWNFTNWIEFRPVEWKILASSFLRPEKLESSTTMSIKYELPSIKLTREALRVLLILQNDMRISQRQLAKEAQTSVTTAGNHYNRLIPPIITPYIGFEHPPLPEGIITLITCPSMESCNQLVAGIRLLPVFQVWHLSPTSNNDQLALLLTVNCPQGGLVPFATTLGEVVSFYEAVESIPIIASKQLPQIRELPLALFKTVGQEWICSSMLLESLFNPTSQ
jgi:DNA-binding MarR family transcriptional regulator